MGFDPQTIINSQLGVGLGLLLGRLIPPGLGHPAARWIADRIAARRNWNLVRAARANQWVAHQTKLTSAELDEAVRETFRHAARNIYDINHFFDNPQAADHFIQFDPASLELIERSQTRRSGFVLVGIHLGNFDFVMRTAFRRGLQALVLTLPELAGGYQTQYKMRKDLGMEILPASKSALRAALERLRAGGTVLTGIDRPLQEAHYQPHFFGRPACLPTHYISLALKADVPVILAATRREADGKYHFQVSDPVTMRPHRDRRVEILRNAEAVLAIAEGYIRQSPTQWALFHPVWPQVLAELPR